MIVNEVLLAASFAFNLLGAVTTTWMMRRHSLIEGELRGVRESLSVMRETITALAAAAASASKRR
jgi:hypothetical protein